MNDDFLYRFRQEPPLEFAAALYKKINRPIENGVKQAGMRFVALTVSVFAVLALAVWLSPTARAFAAGLIREVGGYVFTDANVDSSNRSPSQIWIDRTKNSISVEIRGNLPTAADPVEAGRLAGFAILHPSYLPPGFTPMSDWIINSDTSGVTVFKGYHDAGIHFFGINELKANPGAPAVTFHRDLIVDVNVRGASGVWLPAPLDEKNALVWEENGLTYSIISDFLSLDEATRIANSLGR